MTPSAREEIERYAQAVFSHNGWNTGGEPFKLTEVPLIKLPDGKYVLYSDHLTQVEKARRDAYNDVINMIECHHVDEECPDHELADCTHRIIEEIRNKLEKESK